MRALEILMAVFFLLILVNVGGAMPVTEDPKLQPNDSWVILNGQVEQIQPESFRLRYGADSVLVEMDDGDHDGDGFQLVPGDRVSVFGKVDRDFFEKTSKRNGRPGWLVTTVPLCFGTETATAGWTISRNCLATKPWGLSLPLVRMAFWLWPNMMPTVMVSSPRKIRFLRTSNYGRIGMVMLFPRSKNSRG